jgi:putative ABC transport system ATP-binding protein
VSETTLSQTLNSTVSSEPVAVTPQGAVALQAERLCKQVLLAGRSLSILQDIDLSVSPGQSLAILGRSGSGKTTLLGLLAGLDTPSSGAVTLFGHPLSRISEDARAAVRAQHVGFVFQNFQLIPTLSALQNVLLPLELKRVPDARNGAGAYLERLGLADRMHHFPAQLSGGEQQRVALARAFVGQPDILFADEPTGNLDSCTGEQIIEQMFELNRAQGTTLILVTHDEALAARCQRRIVLDSGRLVSVSALDRPA